MYYFFKTARVFLDFVCCYSVSHCSDKPIHSNYRFIISLSVGKRTKSAGDQIIPLTVYTLFTPYFACLLDFYDILTIRSKI